MILAIDPGPSQSAWCILRDDGTPSEAAIEPNEAVLDQAKGVVHSGHKLVIEMFASYGMPVGAECFETCLWIGRFIQASGQKPLLLRRKEIGMHLCNHPRANDSTVRQALIDRFGPPGTKKAPGVLYGFAKDKWSALAVAVTAYDQLGQQNAG